MESEFGGQRYLLALLTQAQGAFALGRGHTNGHYNHLEIGRHLALNESYWETKFSVNSRELTFGISGERLNSGTLSTCFGNPSLSQSTKLVPLEDQRVCPLGRAFSVI